MIFGKQLTGLREITVRTDMVRGMKAITEKRIHLEATILSIAIHSIREF